METAHFQLSRHKPQLGQGGLQALARGWQAQAEPLDPLS
jgi:hypothetical protein